MISGELINIFELFFPYYRESKDLKYCTKKYIIMLNAVGNFRKWTDFVSIDTSCG